MVARAGQATSERTLGTAEGVGLELVEAPAFAPVPEDVHEGLEGDPCGDPPDEREAWREAVRLARASATDDLWAEAESLEAAELEALADEDVAEAERLAAEAEELRERAQFLERQAMPWARCGVEFWAEFCESHAEQEVRRISCRCNSRVCPECQAAYRSRLIKSWSPLFEAVERGDLGGRVYGFKHLILTAARCADRGLGEQARWLLGKGRDLIKHFWARGGWRGRGALISLEVSPGGGSLHLHCLVFGQFVAVTSISSKWEELTDNKVVWIRKCAAHKISEVIKYASKFQDLPPSDLVDLLVEFRGLRRIRAYGRFFGGEFRTQPVPEPRRRCRICGGKLSRLPWPEWEELHGDGRRRFIGALLADAVALRSGRSPPPFT